MFCYVILHYMDIDTTLSCIEHLKKTAAVDSKFIIVDNASPNESGAKLTEHFQNDEQTDVIISSKNLGFAKGNNLGYLFAKDKYSPDFMVVMNNDVLIEQTDFEAIIERRATAAAFDVIAPDIINNDGLHQNPSRKQRFSSKNALKLIITNELKRVLIMTNAGWSYYLKHKRREFVMWNTQRLPESTLSNAVPHGACIIFGKRYIENEDWAFLPVTYMYGEEDLLFDYLNQKNYKIGFCLDAVVRHLEDAATNKAMKDQRSKTRFVYKYQSRSLMTLLKKRMIYRICK